jgi:hypothetical protein
MTTAILQITTKTLLRWSQNNFIGKSAAPNRVILRHGAAGRTGKPASAPVPNVNGAMNPNAGDATLPLQRRADRHENKRIHNQPILAFGVRLIC